MTAEQLELVFEEDKLGAVYKGTKDYKLTSESGKVCTLHTMQVYPIVYLETENSIAVLGVDEENAVAISLFDPDFELMDCTPLNPLC